MTRQQLKKEWKRLKFEIVENKPQIEGTYPPNVVLLRDLLFVAQALLGKIERKENVVFNEEIYQRTMNFYESRIHKYCER